MNIIRIFEQTLFSIHYENENTNEFDRLFEIWQDVEWLENFFEENKEDLSSGFLGTVSVEDAVLATIQEARLLENRLLQLAESGEKGQLEGLNKLFKPLHNSQYRIVELMKSKAYGNRNKSWLRIYALKIAENMYLITGGAIKLTATMEERLHTKAELAKMERCRDFLRENGLIDEDSFRELEI